jgi:hypothetical protein
VRDRVREVSFDVGVPGAEAEQRGQQLRRGARGPHLRTPQQVGLSGFGRLSMAEASMGPGAGTPGLVSTPSWGLSVSLSPAVVFSARRVGNEAGVSISEPRLR